MRTLAAWCHDRRRTVIGLWVAAFVLIAALWATAAGEYVNNFRLPGTESQRAYDLLKDRFPQQSGDTANVVFAVDEGGVLDAATARRSRRSARRSRSRPRCSRSAIRSRAARPSPPDGKITFAQIQFRQGAGDVDAAAVKTMAEDTLALDGQGGVQVALGGDIIHWSTAEQGGAGEIFGLLVAAIVLFLTLGLVAMGLPLLNALFAMVVSLGADVDRRHPSARRRRLDAAAGGDDRDRRRHRLRAADPQPLPAGARRWTRRARGDARLDRHVRPRGAVRRHRGRDRDARHAAARHLVPLRTGDRRRALRAVHDVRLADADAGADGQPDRPPDQAGEGDGRRRRRRPGRSRERVRRALERVRRAPAAAGRDPRARRADRPCAARAAHAPRDQRRQHVQEGRHDPGRLRPAQGGLRPGLQRSAAARDRAAARGRRRGAAADRRRAARPGRDRRGPAAAAQRGRRHGDDDRLPDDDAAGRAHRRDGQAGTRRHPAADRARRPARACRSAARPRATSTSPRRSATSSRCSSASWSGSRSCCSRSCSARC